MVVLPSIALVLASGLGVAMQPCSPGAGLAMVGQGTLASVRPAAGIHTPDVFNSPAKEQVANKTAVGTPSPVRKIGSSDLLARTFFWSSQKGRVAVAAPGSVCGFVAQKGRPDFLYLEPNSRFTRNIGVKTLLFEIRGKPASRMVASRVPFSGNLLFDQRNRSVQITPTLVFAHLSFLSHGTVRTSFVREIQSLCDSSRLWGSTAPETTGFSFCNSLSMTYPPMSPASAVRSAVSDSTGSVAFGAHGAWNRHGKALSLKTGLFLGQESSKKQAQLASFFLPLNRAEISARSASYDLVGTTTIRSRFSALS